MTTIRTLLTGTVAWLAIALLPALVQAQEIQWRSDYLKSRQEAVDKNRPLILDIGTPDCFWCKQLDMRTFRDPTIISMMNGQCIPLKVDAIQNPTLTEKLGVRNYPTLVFASPDGRIL